MQKTLKNLDVNVGSVIAGSEMEIKKAKQRVANKKYYNKNKKILIKRVLNWYEKNKEKRKIYYLLNKNKIFKRTKLWSEKNRDKINKRINNRIKTDYTFKLKKNLRNRVNLAIRGLNKSKTTMKLLGCSIEFLKQHIEKQFKPGMSWDKRHLFHIDHIRPCASFDLSKPEEQEKCFHYTNLQPLWAKDNLSKGAKYDG
jgi:hypothetical protein